jgi:predicted nucleic acid-binding protein
MPVVSDASPLILLAKIERLDLLKVLYQEIIIPLQVRDEITRYNDDASSRIILAYENGCSQSCDTPES